MDPVTLIASAPPEWVPALIIIALLYKFYALWMEKRVIRKTITEEMNKTDVEE